jgi:hypothetical protein
MAGKFCTKLAHFAVRYEANKKTILPSCEGVDRSIFTSNILCIFEIKPNRKKNEEEY